MSLTTILRGMLSSGLQVAMANVQVGSRKGGLASLPALTCALESKANASVSHCGSHDNTFTLRPFAGTGVAHTHQHPPKRHSHGLDGHICGVG